MKKKIFEELMDSLLIANRLMNEYESKPRHYGNEDVLYSVECHTLRLINNEPDITITEIAKKMRKTKSASSQIIDKLVKKGYLQKNPHPTSNRTISLKLTEKGEIINANHESFDNESYLQILNDLNDFSVEELALFVKIQKKINERFEKNLELY